jgi:hypothetical protein
MKTLRTVFLVLWLISTGSLATQAADVKDNKYNIIAKKQGDAVVLVKKYIGTGKETTLVDTIYQPFNDKKVSGPIASIAQDGIVQSNDKEWVYFLTNGWQTSRALHRVKVDGSYYEYLTDANSVKVIRKGKYKDMLVIDKHIYPLAGSAMDLLIVYDPGLKKEICIFAGDYSQIEEWQLDQYFSN